jgi:hypothetical protein
MMEGYSFDPFNDPFMGLMNIVVNCALSEGVEFFE